MKKNNVIKFNKKKGKTKVIYPYGRAEVISIKKKKKQHPKDVRGFFGTLLLGIIAAFIFVSLGMLVAEKFSGH